MTLVLRSRFAQLITLPRPLLADGPSFLVSCFWPRLFVLGARLLWDGVSFLELSVPAKMRGNMCGLCGNFNGDKRDDFIGRRGALLSSGQEFGNSWRVGGKKACSVLPRDVPPHPPTCKGDWEGSIQSDKHCGAIRSSLFTACHSAVPPQFYFKACRIDMCECPGTQCHCEVRIMQDCGFRK